MVGNAKGGGETFAGRGRAKNASAGARSGVRSVAGSSLHPDRRRRAGHAQFPRAHARAALQADRGGGRYRRGLAQARRASFRRRHPRQHHARQERRRLAGRTAGDRFLCRGDPDHRLCRSRNRDPGATRRCGRFRSETLPLQPDPQLRRPLPRQDAAAAREFRAALRTQGDIRSYPFARQADRRIPGHRRGSRYHCTRGAAAHLGAADRRIRHPARKWRPARYTRCRTRPPNPSYRSTAPPFRRI